jgi:hypothetical protein
MVLEKSEKMDEIQKNNTWTELVVVVVGNSV